MAGPQRGTTRLTMAALQRPVTRYARSGEIGIAYQVIGKGETDLVVAFPFVSHLDLLWESPPQAYFIRRRVYFRRFASFAGLRLIDIHVSSSS